MACKVLERLKLEEKSHRDEWAYFAYPQNKDLHRQSDHRAKQLAKEYKKKWEEASAKIALHGQGTCPDCK